MKGCSICNGTGLVPFLKSGRIIPHVKLFCECHQPEPEYSIARKPEDFDFPMSHSVYRSLCQEHGWQDPGPDTLQVKQEIKPTFRPRPIDDEVDQLKAGFLFLQNKINQHLDIARKKTKSSTYKGLPS